MRIRTSLARAPARAVLLGLALARSATAQTSVDLRPVTPGSPDLVLRWESASTGPFHLLRRDVPETGHASHALPLDPVADRVATDVTSPLALPGAGDPAAAPPGVTLYQVVDDAGGCSNVAHVIRFRPAEPPGCRRRVAWLAIPWRGPVRDARGVLDSVPSASSVTVLDARACAEVTLTRGAAPGYNGFIRPGQGALVALEDDRTIVLVGAGEPRRVPLDLSRAPSCADSQLLSFPVGALEDSGFDELCGPGWRDANGDGRPDACPGGLHGGRTDGKTIIRLTPSAVTGSVPLEAFGHISTFASGVDFPAVPGGAIAFRHFHDVPAPTFRPDDEADPDACRCPDSDGDGTDDCTERLDGTDALDPATGPSDVDRDGVADAADSCPTDADPLASNRDGDARGDACDPCPDDPADACADADGDGVPDGFDNCPVPNPGQEDRDRDGHADACDNCPARANPCQEDATGTGAGDACDGDGDDVDDATDNCVSVANADQANADGDAWGDACDPCPVHPGDGVQDLDGDGDGEECFDGCPHAWDPSQADADGDGVGDACEPRDDRGCCAGAVVARTAWSEAAPSDLAADDLGNVYLTALPRTGGAFLAVSRDGGETWEAPRDLGLPAGVGASLLASPGGTVLAWAVAPTGVVLRRSEDQARSFAPPLTVLGPVTSARVAGSPEGLVIAAAVLPDRDVVAAASTDGGRTFGAPRPIGRTDEAGVALAVTGSCATIAHSTGAGGFADVVAISSSDDGRTWSPVLVLRHAWADGSGETVLAAGIAAGRIVVVGHDGSGPAVSASSDCGQTWSAQEALVGARFAPVDAISAASDGTVVLVGAATAVPTWCSSSGGLPGTWPPAAAANAAEPGTGWTGTPAAGPRNGSSVMAFTARPPGAPRVQVLFGRSCDGGAHWSHAPLRVDTDSSPAPALRGTQVARGPDGRTHVAWGAPCGSLGPCAVEHAAIDGTRSLAVRASDVTPPCEATRVRLEADAPPSHCAFPAYAWRVDGVEVAGATTSTIVLSGDGAPGARTVEVELSCVGVVACEQRASPVTVDLAPAPSDLGASEVGLLLVTRSAGTLRLAWTVGAPGASGCSVYAGTLPALTRDFAYDHRPLACHVARTPSDAPDMSLALALPPRDEQRYYLIAPANCLSEGGLGRSSRGVGRPLAPAVAACGPMP